MYELSKLNRLTCEKKESNQKVALQFMKIFFYCSDYFFKEILLNIGFIEEMRTI